MCVWGVCQQSRSCPNLVQHQLVLGERGDGRHQPAVSQYALAHVKPAGSSGEEMRALAEILGGRGGRGARGRGGGGGGGGQGGRRQGVGRQIE